MTAEEMCGKMVGLVRQRHCGVSFVELMNAVGPEAEGDYTFEAPADYNIVWWAGMSETFVHALELSRAYIDPCPTSVLVYAYDGSMLRLPLVKRAHKYKEPHWIPMTFSMKGEGTSQKRRRKKI